MFNVNVGQYDGFVRKILTEELDFKQIKQTENYILYEHTFDTNLIYDATKLLICYNQDFLSIDAYIRMPNSLDKMTEVAVGLFSGYIVSEEFFYLLLESLNIKTWIENNGEGLYSYYCRSLGINGVITPISESDYKKIYE